ncbi:MAG TPA: hypothetical protein VFZ16_17955 [Hyphomicrobiaceae bacterium]|nr:hypothetical protein [Hyphomicrobiaceae bacterium]
MRHLGSLAVALVCSGLCTGLAASSAEAQRRDRGRDWVELGCRQVNVIGADRDVIRVGRREGRFKAIRLTARGNDIEMLDLKVIYANGAPDDIPVRARIRQGTRTRPLDLKGRGRAIQQINIVYSKPLNLKGLLGGKATICAEGLE